MIFCLFLLQATQAGTERQLAKTSVNLANSIAAIATLERDLAAAGEKYAFLQDMRAYISDLCDMLQVPACACPWSHARPCCYRYQGKMWQHFL